MNALVGQEAKPKFALAWLICDCGSDDCRRKDGGDFACAGAGGHLRGRGEFEVLHDGSGELQPSQMMCLIFQTGWQFRAISAKGASKVQTGTFEHPLWMCIEGRISEGPMHGSECRKTNLLRANSSKPREIG
jgi:hypothetical protein